MHTFEHHFVWNIAIRANQPATTEFRIRNWTKCIEKPAQLWLIHFISFELQPINWFHSVRFDLFTEFCALVCDCVRACFCSIRWVYYWLVFVYLFIYSAIVSIIYNSVYKNERITSYSQHWIKVNTFAFMFVLWLDASTKCINFACTSMSVGQQQNTTGE